MRLEGKVAVVTGASRGIGKGIAERFVAEGASVVIADILGSEAHQTAAAIGGNCRAVEFNCTSEVSIRNLIECTHETYGAIDILVNNAAIRLADPFLEITPERFDAVFNVNVKGLLFTMQLVARSMIQRGGGGKIINITSKAGRRGQPNAAVYSASKATVISLTQSAALALVSHGINVNAIAPGEVDTEMTQKLAAERAQETGLTIEGELARVASTVPAGRLGLPLDYGAVASFLASTDADYIVGQTLNVDGGIVLS